MESDISSAADPERELNKIKELRHWATALEQGDPFIASSAVQPRAQNVRNMNISLCYSCKRQSVWLNDKMIYPNFTANVSLPNDDLPPNAKLDYIEASRVLATSPRSACALLRLTIQNLCEHVLNKSGNINDLIGDLVKQGLSPVVQKALDAVRVIGNEAVHPGQIDLRDDRETSSKLFLLVNVIADTLITQPRHILDLYSMIPPEKLNAITRRDR